VLNHLIYIYQKNSFKERRPILPTVKTRGFPRHVPMNELLKKKCYQFDEDHKYQYLEETTQMVNKIGYDSITYAIVDLYFKGLSGTEIGKKIEKTKEQVYNILNALNIPRRQQGGANNYSKFLPAIIALENKEKMSIPQIAKAVGCHRTHAFRLWQEYQFPKKNVKN